MCVARLARVNAPALVRPSPPVVPEEQVVFCVMVLVPLVEGWWWWWWRRGSVWNCIPLTFSSPSHSVSSPPRLRVAHRDGRGKKKKKKVFREETAGRRAG